jgi:hypothetical protein
MYVRVDSCSELFVVFISFSRQMPVECLKLGHDRFLLYLQHSECENCKWLTYKVLKDQDSFLFTDKTHAKNIQTHNELC